MHLKILSAKWWPSCPKRDKLNTWLSASVCCPIRDTCAKSTILLPTMATRRMGLAVASCLISIHIFTVYHIGIDSFPKIPQVNMTRFIHYTIGGQQDSFPFLHTIYSESGLRKRNKAGIWYVQNISNIRKAAESKNVIENENGYNGYFEPNITGTGAISDSIIKQRRIIVLNTSKRENENPCANLTKPVPQIPKEMFQPWHESSHFVYSAYYDDRDASIKVRKGECQSGVGVTLLTRCFA